MESGSRGSRCEVRRVGVPQGNTRPRAKIRSRPEESNMAHIHNRLPRVF